MLASQWLKAAEAQLNTAGIQTARLDALVLLEDCLGIDRALILAKPELEISAAQQLKLKNLLKQRAQDLPLAYVRGHVEFYGRDFAVSPAVMVPRPESEAMIDLLGDLSAAGELAIQDRRGTAGQDYDLAIADVGTGSGALGITAQLEFPPSLKVRIDLLDIDQRALETAQFNVDKYTMPMAVVESDLLRGSRENYAVLLCNLPYVPDDYPINRAAGHEPKIALFGGPDGLDIYRQLFQQVSQLAKQPLFILTEAFSAQHALLTALAGRHGYEIVRSADFIQVFKLSGKPKF